MKNLPIRIGACVLVLIAILPAVCFASPKSKSETTGGISFSYFEDTKGQLSISDIENVDLTGEFTQIDGTNFAFGRSHSTYWIKIPTDDPQYLKEYTALFCPNIQNVQLYTPSENGYEVRYSGWANSSVRNDERLAYPVFRLDPHTLGEKPIYMRIESCYSHNYTLEFYTQKELNQVRIIEFCLYSFFFGMLISVVLMNSIAYFRMKNKIFMAFSICILLLTIHQSINYGMHNILMPEHSYVFMSLSIEIGLLFIVSIIVFFGIFSDVKAYSKRYYKCLLIFIAACLLDYPVCFMDKVAANFYGHCLTIIVPIVILYFSFRMQRAGHKEQRLFMLGWGLTILLYTASMLVCEGMIQIGFLSFHLPIELIVMLAVSVVFTIAIAEHVRQMQLESQQIRQQYQTVTEQVKMTEVALMQTQIKPHFLYNTLTAIEQLCEVDSQKAQTAIADFANYLRTNIDFSTETRLILIEKELENVKQYLSLEQIRFEDRLNVTYDIKAGGFMVPPLVIQPIVENAVRHGVTKKPEGGTVSISVEETETAYTITVSDNGMGFAPESIDQNGRGHIGICNVRERLARMCHGTLEISSQLGANTTVVIMIPKETENEPN
ncbi:histidine kinase [Oscillibacter sp.]|uniref:histidine kinase n=1 Tax=Oscillibacter sp. TaxID=1945593 RepID=UPI0028AE0211|nr:histidine kinase [Oscillibacter sp.]